MGQSGISYRLFYWPMHSTLWSCTARALLGPFHGTAPRKEGLRNAPRRRPSKTQGRAEGENGRGDIGIQCVCVCVCACSRIVLTCYPRDKAGGAYGEQDKGEADDIAVYESCLFFFFLSFSLVSIHVSSVYDKLYVSSCDEDGDDGVVSSADTSCSPGGVSISAILYCIRPHSFSVFRRFQA